MNPKTLSFVAVLPALALACAAAVLPLAPRFTVSVFVVMSTAATARYSFSMRSIWPAWNR